METKIDLGYLTTDGKVYPAMCNIGVKDKPYSGGIRKDWPYCFTHEVYADYDEGCPAMHRIVEIENIDMGAT